MKYSLQQSNGNIHYLENLNNLRIYLFLFTAITHFSKQMLSITLKMSLDN